jgi:hypothetical protein
MAIRVGWVLLRVLETFGHGFESHRQLHLRSITSGFKADVGPWRGFGTMLGGVGRRVDLPACYCETFGHGFESHRQLPVRMPEIRCQMPDTLDSGIWHLKSGASDYGGVRRRGR